MVEQTKDSRAVSSDQTETTQKPKNATKQGDTSKNNTGTSLRILRCCLPDGEAYTDQPINRKAAEIEARARAWMFANPSVWRQWSERVKRDTANKRRWSVQALAESTRAEDRVNDSGESFKVNNDLLPALSRILCEEIPEAGQYVELRTSIFERARSERLKG